MTVGHRSKAGGASSVAVTSVHNPPPIHVHVDSATPVLVHIRKTKKDGAKSVNTDYESRPWIPPPGKTTKGVETDYGKPKAKLLIPDYIPDADLSQEVNDMIVEHIQKCIQHQSMSPTPNQGGQQFTCPQHNLCAGSDNVTDCQFNTTRAYQMYAGQEDKFLRRSLNVLRRDQPLRDDVSVTESSRQERISAGQDRPSNSFTCLSRFTAGGEMAEGTGELSDRLEAAEQKNQTLICDLREQESTIDGLKRQIKCEKDYIQSLCRMQTELEETRACLQKELLSKNAEIERATIQMKNLQCQMNEHLAEVERLQAFVEQTTRRAECEKEAMKKTLRAQSDKAARCEDSLNKASMKIECMEQDADRMRHLMKTLENELDVLRPEMEAKKELERVCQKLQAHLKELQPLPDMLKGTELKLQEEQAKLAQHEQRISEQARLIIELTGKIDGAMEEVRLANERLETACCENEALQQKMETLACMHQQGQDTITELNSSLQLKTELINQLNLKLEDKDNHSMSINRQLEEALAESNRLSRLVEERAFQLEKLIEKQSHGKVKELEAQLACSKQEIKQMKQEKTEMECKYGRQMTDLKEKLEQCDMATHNMQSYISYLRTSYASVFNDPNLTAMCSPPSPRKDVC